MSNKDIQKKSEKDLQKALKEKRESLRGFRFGLSGSSTRNSKEGKNLKKGIAQILTELQSRV